MSLVFLNIFLKVNHIFNIKYTIFIYMSIIMSLFIKIKNIKI